VCGSATMNSLRDCFTHHFVVVVLCAFACFQSDLLPARYAFMSAA
jgi:hypothetical protein